MTLAEANAIFDSRRENAVSVQTKNGWLSELDAKINSELLNRYGLEKEFAGYTALSSGDTELLAPPEYGEIYFLYLVMKDDFLNAEITRYNNSAYAFNSLYAEMADFINRNHRCVGASFIKAGDLYA